jgi:hypothetical protein
MSPDGFESESPDKALYCNRADVLGQRTPPLGPRRTPRDYLAEHWNYFIRGRKRKDDWILMK